MDGQFKDKKTKSGKEKVVKEQKKRTRKLIVFIFTTGAAGAVDRYGHV